MKIEKIETGIHTIELYACNLKYSQVQKVIDYLVDKDHLRIIKRDPFNIDRHVKSNYLVNEGIRMRGYQSQKCSNGIGLAINPCTLLEGTYQPTDLFHPKKKSCQKLLEQTSSAMYKLDMVDNPHQGALFVEPEDLSLSQMDLTMNLWFDEDVDLTDIIRLFSKGNIPRYFKRHQFKEKKNSYINRYCFIMESEMITFKVYDKVHELKDNNRCPEELRNKKILRIEVSIKRKEFIRKFELDKNGSLHKMLKTGYKNLDSIITDYMEKLFPCRGKHVRYGAAKKMIEKADIKPKTKKQMLFLLKKTSDGDGLDTALEKLKKEYKTKSNGPIEKLYKNFDKLGISPITLRNDSSIKEMPCILDMISEAEK